MGRFTRWKVKLQRVTGYIGLGTFLIVLYQLVRDLWASPYLPWRPDNFEIFLFLTLTLVALFLIILAHLDWKLVFPTEMGIGHSRDPMFFSTAFRDAATLRWLQNDPLLEQRLRDMYRTVGREREFDAALSAVRKAKP